jgi:hypothetical protein
MHVTITTKEKDSNSSGKTSSVFADESRYEIFVTKEKVPHMHISAKIEVIGDKRRNGDVVVYYKSLYVDLAVDEIRRIVEEAMKAGLIDISIRYKGE